MKGTREQIKVACSIIEDIVKEEVEYRDVLQKSADSRPSRLKPNHQQPLFLTSDSHIQDETVNFEKLNVQTEELRAVNENHVTEVYVSSITDPSFFYVQKVGPSSIALDKLVQEMTAHYEQDYNRVTLLKVFNFVYFPIFCLSNNQIKYVYHILSEGQNIGTVNS